MQEFDAYWYARGYYDGRCHGFEHPNAASLTGLKRYSYKHGYNAGVADYCDVQDPPREHTPEPSNL